MEKAEVVKMSVYEYDRKEEYRRMLKAAYIDREERGKAIGELEEAKIIFASIERLCNKNIADF